MVELVKLRDGRWGNYHRTLDRMHVAEWGFGRDDGSQDAVAFFGNCARLAGDMVESCRLRGEQLLPVGSKWSFSDLLKGGGLVLETDVPDRIHHVDASLLDPASPLTDNLVLASAGTRIADLNAFLEPHLSLTTSGAHDGQTVGGLLGTGTHGSVIGCGAFQNQVRGVLLATGKGSSFWVERGPRRILNAAAADGLASTTILEPDVFDATLVHLGGMGIVVAVLLEVAPGYTLDVVRRESVLGAGDIGLLRDGDFRGFARRLWPALDEDPYYVEVILNPFHALEGLVARPRPALVTLYFKRPPANPLIGLAYGEADDVLNLLERSLEASSGADLLIPPELIAELVAIEFKETPAAGRAPERKTWGQLNGAHHRQRVGPIEFELYNAAYALPRDRLDEALATMLAAFNSNGGGHLVFTLRFVSSAAGLLTFTRFAETVVVNLDGLRTGASRDATAKVALALEQAGIPFGQHWGKMGVISPARFRRDHGDPADATSRAGRWLAARRRLVGAASDVLRNDALATWGLV